MTGHIVTDMDALATRPTTAGTQPSPVAPPGRNGEPCGRRSGRLLEGARCSPSSSSASTPAAPPSRAWRAHYRRPRLHPPVVSPAASTVVLCREAWGAAAGPPRRHAPHPEQHDDPPHCCCSRRQRQRARSAPSAPALSPGHPGLDRHRLSLQRRPQRKHLPAERSQPRWRHRNKLRPHRPFPRRLRRKLRRGRGDGSSSSTAPRSHSLGRRSNSTSRPISWRDTGTQSADTSCPGASLYAHVTSGDLRGRVDGILAAGPVDLPIICGPEADAMVAEIEAGSR